MKPKKFQKVAQKSYEVSEKSKRSQKILNGPEKYRKYSKRSRKNSGRSLKELQKNTKMNPEKACKNNNKDEDFRKVQNALENPEMF